jgi:hypothetical protein
MFVHTREHDEARMWLVQWRTQLNLQGQYANDPCKASLFVVCSVVVVVVVVVILLFLMNQ